MRATAFCAGLLLLGSGCALAQSSHPSPNQQRGVFDSPSYDSPSYDPRSYDPPDTLGSTTQNQSPDATSSSTNGVASPNLCIPIVLPCTGCSSSPENPTYILATLAMGMFAFSRWQLRRKVCAVTATV